MEKLFRAAQILLLPLHLLASNQIFETGSMVRLANPSAGIYDVYWLFDSSNHYFGHYPLQAVPAGYSSYFEEGSYTLNSLGNNQVLAELNSAAYATLGYGGGTGSASRNATVTLTSPFSANYSGTRTEIGGDTESFNGNLTIYPAQDYAPEVLPTGLVLSASNDYYYESPFSAGYDGGTTYTIQSSTILQREYDTVGASYTYRKLGPNTGLISAAVTAESYTNNINLFFVSPTEGYYYGSSRDSYGSYTVWGALSVTYPPSYSPPAIFPALSALPQDQILQITGTNSDLSLNLAGGTWTDASGGSGSFTHTYAVQSGGVAGLTLNRSGQNAPNDAEHFALRFTDDGVGEVAYSSLDGSQSFNLVDAPTWEVYDDFSGSTIDTQKWDIAYWDGGNLPTLSNGSALLSGNTVSNWNATQVTEAMLQANRYAANLVSGGLEAHSILDFKDSGSILGIEMELTLPIGVYDDVGIGLYAVDYDVMLNTNQDPVIFSLDLWNSSTFSLPEVQITWRDPFSGTEQKANGVPVAAGQTVLLKFERTEDTIRFFVDDIQVAESGYSSGNETFMIRAVSENGDSFLTTVDNVRVLRDTPPVDPPADTDGDGLSDSVETNTGVYVSPSDTGTNPNNADTDGDGVNDGAEVSNGTDPNEAPEPQLPVIESYGNTDLLKDSSGYYAGSADTPLLYNGRQLSRKWPDSSYTVLGVDLVNGIYRVVMSYNNRTYYAANFAQNGSNSSTLARVSYLLAEEVNLQQDFDGDGHVGWPPPASIAGMQFEYTSTDGYTSVPYQELYGSDGLAAHGFSSSITERFPYTYSNGVISYPEWSEGIRLTFTSANSGNYEYFEADGEQMEVDDSGTFTVVTPSLQEEIEWQRMETFDSPLSNDFWQVKRRNVDSLAYDDGELSFIFGSSSQDSDSDTEVAYARTLPMDDDWQVVLDDIYAAPGLSNFEIGVELEIASPEFECELSFQDNGYGRQFAVYIGQQLASGTWEYASAYVGANEDARISSGGNVRIVHIASSRDLIFEYQPDGASDWSELARLNLESGSFVGENGYGNLTGGLISSTDHRMSVEIEAEAGVATQIADLEIAGIEIGNYTPPVDPSVDTDGDGLYDSVETNTGIYVSPSDTGTNPNNADTSGDGFTDFEAISAGVDPNSDYVGLLNIVRQNPDRFDIFNNQPDPGSIVDMQMGSVGLERGTNGNFNMNFDLEISTDLQTWTPYTNHTIEISVPDQSKTFMRLNVK